jgi:hypothetical protein
MNYTESGLNSQQKYSLESEIVSISTEGCYKQYAPKLVEFGYTPTPCNGKKPRLSGWSNRPDVALKYDNYPNDNVGIVLGGPNHICAFDIDIPFEPAASIVREWLVDNFPTMPERIGLAPKTMFIARREGSKRKITSSKFYNTDHETGEVSCDANGKTIGIQVEVLSDGQQFIAYGNHPDTGQEYEWPDDDLLSYKVSELPIISDLLVTQFLEFAEGVCERYFVSEIAVRVSTQITPVSLDPLGLVNKTPLSTVTETLRFVSADSYQIWVNVGIALRNEYGDEAFTVWDDWSATSDHYEESGKNTCKMKWETFKDPAPDSKRITIGTIFWYAKENGWERPQECPSTNNQDKNLILTSAEFVDGFVAPDYLVDGIIQRRYLYSLTARTGDGKTAVLLSLAANVAQANDFGNCDTTLGRVCYFAGENPDDVRARWLLMAEVMEFDSSSIDVHFIPGTFSIPELFSRVQSEAKDVGGFDLIIVDTSAAYFQGDEENSNTQLGQHARDIRDLTTLPGGPCVIVACHPVKNPSKETLLPRGGGAFTAEVDGNLTLWSEDKVTTELNWAGKFRGPSFEPMSFRMEPKTVDSVVDSKGRLMPSVIAIPITDEMAQQELAKAIRDEEAVLVSMLNDPSLSMAQIATELGWLSAKTSMPQKSKVEKAIKALKEERLVKKSRKKWRLTDSGKKEAESVISSDKMGLFR